MTEILLLGTFHFMESSIDFYSPKAQEELRVLSSKLAQFKPDTIAIEAASHAQADIDRSYDKFCLADLQDGNKMRNETLGDIHIFGGVYPVLYNNEAVQLGYRLGKMLSHEKIYAIDDDTGANMAPMKAPLPSLKEAKKQFKAYSAEEPQDEIIDRLKYLNGDKWVDMSHSLYIQANAVNAGSDYAGAKMVAQWYERNLMIFANIQQLATNSKRMLVVYGAGHLKILKQLIRADCNLALADTYEYL